MCNLVCLVRSCYIVFLVQIYISSGWIKAVGTLLLDSCMVHLCERRGRYSVEFSSDTLAVMAVESPWMFVGHLWKTKYMSSWCVVYWGDVKIHGENQTSHHDR